MCGGGKQERGVVATVSLRIGNPFECRDRRNVVTAKDADLQFLQPRTPSHRASHLAPHFVAPFDGMGESGGWDERGRDS